MTPPCPSSATDAPDTSFGFRHIRAILGILMWLAIPVITVLALLWKAMDGHVVVVLAILAIGGALGIFPIATLAQAGAIAKGVLPWTSKTP